jgi:hypothetical protein
MDGDLRLLGHPAWAQGLTMKPRRYSFDGEMVTVAELALRVTCYSEPWLASALKAGCRSVMDLAVRFHAQGQAGRLKRLPGDRHRLRNFDTKRRLR